MGDLTNKAKDMMNDAENKAHELKGQVEEKIKKKENEES